MWDKKRENQTESLSSINNKTGLPFRIKPVFLLFISLQA